MLSYDSNDKVLKMYRKGVKTLPCEIFDIPKLAYQRFLNVHLENSIRELEATIQEKIVPDGNVMFNNIRTSFSTVDDPKESKSIVRTRIHVLADIESVAGVTHDVELLNMAGLDEDGTFNGRTIVNALVKSEGLSYDSMQGKLQLVLPASQYSFSSSKTSIFLEGFGSKKLAICDLLIASSILLGNVSHDKSKDAILSEFTNSIIVSYMGKAHVKVPLLAVDSADKFAEQYGGFVNYINSERQALGPARRIINRHLSLDKCIGQTLSRPTTIDIPEIGPYTLEEGTIINDTHINLLKQAACNVIYIKYLPNVAGYKLSRAIMITKINKGTKVTPYLVKNSPELEEYAYVPHDIEGTVVFPTDLLLTDDIIRLIRDSGVKQFYIERVPLPITFEHEVISNNTMEICDLFPNGVPAEILEHYGRHDAIYMPAYKQYNNDRTVLTTSAFKSQLMPNKLTVDDIKSLVNFYCGIVTLPELFKAFNKDTDFLKKVATLDITLATILDVARRKFTRKYKQAIKNCMLGQTNKVRETFYAYGKTFNEAYLSKDYSRIIKTSEYLNPVALIAQSSRVVPNIPARQASGAMRNIVMAHYGRLCPYDTPVGSTIGLASSLAASARVADDGTILAPYHPIVKVGSDYYISESIQYMSPEQEMPYRIGDILAVEHVKVLTKDEDTWKVPIRNTPVMARVPASKEDPDNVTVEMVDAYNLDYVNVCPEQAFSTVAQLIPFLGANDGVRVSFTISMIKQSVYIQESELPLVPTTMGKTLLEKDSTYVLRADRDGEIVDITPNAVVTTAGDIPMKDIKVTKQSFTSFDFRKAIGDSVKKGDIIADTVVSRNGEISLGSNCLIGCVPYYGYNNEDGYVMSDGCASRFVSHAISNISMDLKRGGDIQSDFDVGLTTYVGEKEPVFRWSETNRRLMSTVKRTFSTKQGQSGIVYKVIPKYDPRSQRESREAILVDFKKVSKGDKFCGYHGNKGTVALVQKNSLMPCFDNGVILDVLTNICGIPSRMNTGQVLEAHAGFGAMLLGIRINSNSMNGASDVDISELLQFCWELCNKDFGATLMKWSRVYPSALLEHIRTREHYLKNWKGCFLPDGSAKIFNQLTGQYFYNPLMVGNAHYIKLHHQVEDKITGRSGGGENDYTFIYKQPTHGRSRGGGQRFGEMEMFVLEAYGATAMITETLNTKSDNLVFREELERIQTSENSVGWDPAVTLHGNSTKGSELFRYYMEVAGSNVNFKGGSDISLYGVESRRSRNDLEMLTISKAARNNGQIENVLGDIDAL